MLSAASVMRQATAILCALIFMASRALGEDIDLYASPSGSSTGNPTIIVVLDNSASSATLVGGATKLSIARQALSAAISGLTEITGRINVGLVVYNSSTPDAPERGDGAYVRFAARPMSDGNHRMNLIAALQGIDPIAGAGDAAQYAMALEEARRYLGSLAPLGAANAGAKADPAALSVDGAAYVSPLDADGCEKIVVLVIGNGPPSARDSTLAAPYVAALNGGALPSPLVLPVPYPAPRLPASQDAAGDWADELAGLLRRSPYADQAANAVNVATVWPESLVTYAIALHDPAAAAENEAAPASGRALVRNVAAQGGGHYYDATDAPSLSAGITAVFAEAMSVHAVFAAPSLPASAAAAGTLSDQLYLGMFRVDGLGAPRWTGNLKLYRLIYDSSSGGMTLVDALGAPALDALSGFIAPTAQSFWTTARTTGPILPSGSATVDFFANSPSGTGLSATQQARDAPDGNVIEKGGAAQRARANLLGNQSGRKLYTCPLSGCVAGTALDSAPAYAFAVSNIGCATHQAAFGIDPATCAIELPMLVDWVRGADNTSPNNESTPGPGGLGPSPVRASVQGDVIHSRPLLVDYGAGGIIAFYGGNDGVLRAVRAGTGAGGGDELWGFVAPEHFFALKRLRDNAPMLEWPSRSSGLMPPLPLRAGAAPKTWLQDGTITALQTRNAAGAVTGTYVFVTARRGGTFVYAFDVTTPTAPRFLWRHGSHDGTDPAFDDLALTFSAARPASVPGYARPVVIFGGGYDGGYDATGAPVGDDADPRGACIARPAAGCGNRIFVVDALSGALVRSFQSNAGTGGDLRRGVAADVALVDAQGTGLTDRAYAVDTGGAIWRIDFDARGPADWRMYKLAETADALNPRKLLQPPDVVVTARYAGILVGSGDREKPLKSAGADRFYMVKDKATAATVAADGSGAAAAWPIDLDRTAGDSMIDVSALLAEDVQPRASVAANNGWFRTLATAEKVVNAPLTAAGVVYFGTHQPTASGSGRCLARLGTARVYGVAFGTGTPVRDTNQDGTLDARDASVALTGGGLPSPVIGGLTTIRDVATNRDITVPFAIGTAGIGGVAPVVPSQTAPARLEQKLPRSVRKTYWYRRSLP